MKPLLILSLFIIGCSNNKKQKPVKMIPIDTTLVLPDNSDTLYSLEKSKEAKRFLFKVNNRNSDSITVTNKSK